jgi:hypothetical protein
MDRRMRPGTTDKVLAQDSEGTIECPPQSWYTGRIHFWYKHYWRWHSFAT